MTDDALVSPVGHLHQHADGRRCRVPDRHPLVLEDAEPAHRVQVGLVDDQGRADGQGGDDAVTGAGDPAGIGGAPEDVRRVQVEGIPASEDMKQDGPVDVNGALGLAGGTAGEVQQGHVLGPGAGQAAAVRAGRQRVGQGQGAHRQVLPSAVGEQDVAQTRQSLPPGGNLALVVGRGGDQHPGVAKGHACPYRLGTEGGEEG